MVAEPLTPAEWRIMQIVWRKRACSAREVYQEAAERFGWASSTSKTLLRRLAEKNHLTTTTVGNSFLYRPAATVVPTLLAAAEAFFDQIPEGTTGLVLAHLIKKSPLSPLEIADLRGLLDARDPP